LLFRSILFSLLLSIPLLAKQNPLVKIEWEDDNRLVFTFKNWVKSVSKGFSFYHKESGEYKYFYDVTDGIITDGSLKTVKDTRYADSIIVGQNRPDLLRIAFKNKTKLNITRRVYQKQVSFVFDEKSDKKSSKSEPVKKELVKYSPPPKKYVAPKKRDKVVDKNKKIIVIDAGHGGSDGGAVCKKDKVIEKDVVLSIAKYTAEYLTDMGYKVYLTRGNDTFIKLGKRTKFANNKNGDLFVSIHGNSLPRKKNFRKRNGIETYFLSQARTERAKRVAAKENFEDFDAMSRSGRNNYLNILSREKIIQSHKLALDIQSNVIKHLRKYYYNIEDNGVRQAPFWVLVGATMPSILIEVGYVTGDKDGLRLKDRLYKKRLAKGIAYGVEEYFKKN
jgi:N-acetylmuramoyl-L-alanine amidase